MVRIHSSTRTIYPHAIFLLLFLYFCSANLFAANQVNITAAIDQGEGYENLPINGTISISHDKKEKVDINSFQLEGKALKVTFIKEVPINRQSIQISIYHFEIPSKEPGLYVLPEIKVKVGEKQYRSISSTYEVVPASERTPALGSERKRAKQSPVIQSNVALKLQADFNGTTPLYVGQYLSFVYRFYFNGDIELTKEELPLLGGEGFKKIGDKVIKHYQEGEWNVQEISQQFQAASSGEFSFPPSFVEGYAYYEDPILKKKTYVQPKLHAESPAINVTVSPFPDRGKPTNFQGATGQFTFQVSLLTPTTVRVGEKMKVALDIFSRDAFLDSIPTPLLSRQPGIKGLFRLGDLPSVGTVKNNKKQFIVELYPLTSSVKEIPKIAFSYFDPLANQYETLYSDPIPITVLSQTDHASVNPQEGSSVKQEERLPSSSPKEQSLEQEEATSPTRSDNPEPTQAIEIESIEEDVNEVSAFDKFFGTWMLLWIIPFGILAVLIQIAILKLLSKQAERKKIKSSETLWLEAMQQPNHSAQFFNLLNRAFLLKLYEKKILSSPDIRIEDIPQEGVSGEVKKLLLKLEEKRFANNRNLSMEELMTQAKELFERI